MWIIGPILILTLLAFRLVLPYKIPDKYKVLTFHELSKEFRKVDLWSILIFLFSSIIFSFGFIKVFEIFNKTKILNDQPGFEIKPDGDFYAIVSVMFGIAFGVIAINLILKLWLKDSLEKFWVYYNKKYKFNALLVVNVLTGIFIVAGLGLTFLGTNSCVKFDDKGIYIRKIFSTKTLTYNYSDIEDLVHYERAKAPNGDIIDKPHYKIIFKDKFEWGTTDEMRESKDSDKLIFDFLANKANKKIKDADVDE